jgi:hypothetical protein
MSNERHSSTHHLPARILDHIIVLADFQLPRFMPFACTAPANEHLPASDTMYKLNGSHKAWHWMIVRNRQ